MKAFLRVFAIFAIIHSISAVSALADEQGLVLPDTLYCKGVDSLKGERDFRNLKDYASIKLSRLNSKSPVLGEDEDTGILSVDRDDHKVILDFGFGPHGGDQYSFYSFSKKGLADLARGDAVQISGLYEDGYHWVGSYHVRALIVLCCHI